MMSVCTQNSSWGGRKGSWEGETASAKPVRSRSLRGISGALAMALAMGMAFEGTVSEALRDRELAGVDAEGSP